MATSKVDKNNEAQRRTSRGARGETRLTRSQILTEALRLVDEAGMAALNMRELARRLGVFPTSIYWYVPSRNELVSGMVELALSDVATDLRNGAWQTRLRTVLRRFRRALQAHPHLAHVIGAEMVSNSALDLPLLEYIVSALEDAGFKGAGLVTAYNTVIAAMCGFVTLELAPPPPEDTAAWAGSLQEEMASISPAEYPALSRNLKNLENRAFVLRWSSGTEKPMDSSFDLWVDVMIQGLALKGAGS
ncbi:TetR/AcrR family transcriptional regulator [Variovorax sp. KK3]|uniref:TetR/AcrR family transcriptional regulator n=1 Tax=Variovorax sp. KK3 TaxID=1855728 RepID=UPI00097C34EA|nr:TetR/AcrR family transcriptional regulator C-terminal domain-containing protein [Variovorax sp. KK3]